MLSMPAPWTSPLNKNKGAVQLWVGDPSQLDLLPPRARDRRDQQLPMPIEAFKEAGSKKALSDEWQTRLSVVARSLEHGNQPGTYETFCAPICCKDSTPPFWVAREQFIKLLGQSLNSRSARSRR